MKGSIYLRKTNDPHWVVSWPDGKKRYKITHYLGEPDLMYQTNQNKKHDTGYKKAEKLLALMQGDVERNCFRIEKYTGGRLTDTVPYIEAWLRDREPNTRRMTLYLDPQVVGGTQAALYPCRGGCAR